MYGIVFIILGNLSGNAIAFGVYVMSAAGHDDPSRGSVIGLAIAALTFACLVHIASRRGGILLNNFFAVAKVLILLMIIILGFLRAGGYTFNGHANPQTYPTHNFDLKKSFQGDGQNTPSFADSLLFIIYTYSGFEQPFYVLSEIKAPRRRFPKYTLIAMLIASLLFVLVNIAFVSALYQSNAHPQTNQTTSSVQCPRINSSNRLLIWQLSSSETSLVQVQHPKRWQP